MTQRLLAIRPTGRGFGFAVLEGPRSLLDWGVKGERYPSVDKSVNKVRKLIERVRPETLVIEDLSGSGHRSRRAHELVVALAGYADGEGLQVRFMTRRQAKRKFDALAPMKQFQLARLIAEQFPELKARLPPYRKPWMSQDSRYAMFEAIALGLAACSSKF